MSDTSIIGGDFPYVVDLAHFELLRESLLCSAGEASSAIWLTAIAFVVFRAWRVLIVTGLFAIALSVNRMAFGGHFLSTSC